ncbi:MAG: class I SAM-dependent methyltransferase, partial [Planctomycetales bacterium]
MRGKAPLRETLAAGLVLLSFWKANRTLVDPFCGIGTLPIEAALIGRNLAPGRNRTFAAEDWSSLDESIWQAAREEACDLALPGLPELIIGTDLDEEALSKARYHAGLAGVEKDIHFQRRDFLELSSKREYGCVIANPPYAETLGTTTEVSQLYQAMPEVLRRLKTWSHFILTAFSGFEGLVGQKADRRRKLFNSRIECTYYQFFGPRPPVSPSPTVKPSPTVNELMSGQDGVGQDGVVENLPANRSGEMSRVRLEPIAQAFGGLSEKAHSQADIFRNRLLKRARHLRRWPGRRKITCYRLYDRDIPEVPLVVDRYEDCLHMAEYERPHAHTTAEHADWLDLMIRTAAETLAVPRTNVFLKHRQRQRGTQQHNRYARDENLCTVSEGGLKFQVNLSDYLDTGLFLDHRITRSMVRQEAKGKRFLNLFGYTGAFTIYAIDGGATSTETVDLSSNYLNWARR